MSRRRFYADPAERFGYGVGFLGTLALLFVFAVALLVTVGRLVWFAVTTLAAAGGPA